MTTLYIFISLILGSGATVAIIKAFGSIQVKKLDVFTETRTQFVNEVNQLRQQMNDLYEVHYKLLEENSQLKIKQKELEDLVNKKSILVNELTLYKGRFQEIKEALEVFKEDEDLNEFKDKIIEIIN